MTATLPRVLLVEDELPIRKFVHAALAGANYQVDDAATGQQALQHATQTPPDVVILDLGLPDMDGQHVIQRLREWLTAPIIVLSARDQEQQKIQALDNGADDYLTKPFSTGELLARTRVALRHANRLSDGAANSKFESGELTVDLAARRVYVADREVHLTPLEYKLLTTLIHHHGKVLTHRQLLKEVWGPDQVQETHYLRVFMATLRRKLEQDPARPRYLLTEQGIGYRLASE
ncbi:MAG TPA: response regulator [Lacipirellulaceae bacterium]|jgi:two-component system KDP operon response regulator KdpE|nr:response regulator [Lacipirellulaceae bacterium]